MKVFSRHIYGKYAALFLAWVLIPCLIIAGCEFLLRAMDYGHDVSPFIPVGSETTVAHRYSHHFLDSFLNRADADSAGDAALFSVSVEKPENAYRIFVFGGSAAYGFPYYCSFARMLQVMLMARYPGVRFEVYNLAYPGLNSHVMRTLAHACRSLRPDAYLVYMGNNEVHGQYGLINELSWGTRRVMTPLEIRLNLRLRGTRLWQLGNAVLARVEREQRTVRLPAFVFHDDPRLVKIGRNFRANLSAIFRAANDGGASVFISTVGANMRHWPPEQGVFQRPISEEKRSAWDRAYDAGNVAAEDGVWEEALRHYRQAASINDSSPALAFNQANALYALGRHEEAHRHYEQALELDGFYWVRARRAVNESVRAAVQEETGAAVYLVDGRDALQAAAEHGIPGNDLFSSGCHLRPKGAHALALAFLDQMTARLPEWIRAQEKPDVPLPDWEECLLLAGMSRDLLQSVLFGMIKKCEAQNMPVVDTLRGELLALDAYDRFYSDEARLPLLAQIVERGNDDYFFAAALVETAVRQSDRITPELELLIHKAAENHPYHREVQLHYARFLLHGGKTEAAAATLHRLIALYPDAYEAWQTLIDCYIIGSGLPHIETLLNNAIRSGLSAAQRHSLMGYASLKQRDEKAFHYYIEALTLNPTSVSAYEGLRKCALLLPEAAARYRQPVARIVQERLHRQGDWRLVASLLEAFNLYEDALQVYKTRFDAHPEEYEALLRLGMVRMQQMEVAAGMAAIKNALLHEPVLRPLLRNMVDTLDSASDASSVGTEEMILAFMVDTEIAALRHYERLGRIREAQQRPEDAFEIYARTLNVFPDAWHVARRIASLIQAHYDKTAATRFWEALVARSPDAVVPRVQLAMAYAAHEESERALAVYSAIQFENMDDAHLLFEIGCDLLDVSAAAQGAAALDRAVSIRPAYAGEAAECCAALAKRLEEASEYGEAAHWYRKAAALAPSTGWYHLRLGIVLEAVGEMDEARAAYELAYTLDSENALALLRLANLLLFAGEIERGATLLAQSVALNPELTGEAGEVCAGFAQKLRDAEAYEDAIAWFYRAMDFAPTVLWHRVHLAETFYANKEYDEAVEQYRYVLLQAPESPLSAARLDDIFVGREMWEARIETWQRIASAHPTAETPQRYLEKAVRRGKY